MGSTLFSSVFELPWWGHAGVALVLTHITIVSVTVFLHRHQAHHALDLHPAVSHFFRLWLWLTTGMVTKEWAAVHRKHHAKCDTPEDPHSPQILGLNRVLWGGVFLYVKEAKKPDTIERYGHGTPDDWLERNLYSKFKVLGLMLMGVADIVLFGIVPGALILITQIVWIPFWAAGVINGIGHYWGYRHWATPDASTNIVPWGVLIGGEELHNNHHAYPTSARLSNKWYEFDLGWLYIRILETLGLAKVKHLAPTPHFTAPKLIVDSQTLQAVIANRYDVMARYAASLRRTYLEERRALQRSVPPNARVLQDLKRDLERGGKTLREAKRGEFADVLSRSRAANRLFHGSRTHRAVGALRRAPRAARQAASGLVPAGRGQRRSGARGVFAAVAQLRVKF
jgi:stearoyl-CoA desaturase (delta-9 desaturase)